MRGFRRPQTRRRAGRMPASRPTRAPSPQTPRLERAKRHPRRPALIQLLRSARPATPTEPAILPRSLRSAAEISLTLLSRATRCTPPSGCLPEHALSSSANGGPAGRTPRSHPRVLRARAHEASIKDAAIVPRGPGVPEPTGRPSTRVTGMIPPAVEVISTSAGTIQWPATAPRGWRRRVQPTPRPPVPGLPSAASPCRPMCITPAHATGCHATGRRAANDGQTILKDHPSGGDLGPDLVLQVELRGLEPLASCMPCLISRSGIVGGGQVRADQNGSAVWQRPEPSDMDWTRSHLVSQWPSGKSFNAGRCRGRTTEKWR